MAAAFAVAAVGMTATGAEASTSHGSHLSALSSFQAPRHLAASETFTIPAGVARFSATIHGTHVSVTKSPSEVPETITCTVTASNPFEYFGGPYGGGEEGLAETQCTGEVYEIETIVALFLNNTEVSYSTYEVYDTASGSANTNYPLEAGDYQTEAQAGITWTYGGSISYTGVAASQVVYLP